MQDYLTFQVDLDAQETVSTIDELSLWSAMCGLLLLKHIPLRRNITVLDVGCGTGFPLLELAQRLGPTCPVYGIDPWETALNRARLKAQVWNVRNVEIGTGKAEHMPFPEGQFDLVVSNLGINNFDDPAAALAECWRVSKPSAKIALGTNLKGHMAEFYQVFGSTLVGLGNWKAIEALTGHMASRVTLDGLTALVEQAGFKLSSVSEESAVMRFSDGSALLRHYFIKLGFLDAWKSVLDPAEQEETFSRLEADLNSRAEDAGELSLTIPFAYVEADKMS
jgi:arsenite methyltransferase